MIGLLTETIGNPTPMEIPFVPQRQMAERRPAVSDRAAEVALPAVDRLLDDREPRRARRRVEASRGSSCSTSTGWARTRSSKGSNDTWTIIRGASQAMQGRRSRRSAAGGRAASAHDGRRRLRARHACRWRSTRCCEEPALRDPRGYIIPSDQPDFLTATKFVNALIKNGITIHRATAAFTRRRQVVSGRLVRREDGAGVPPARARHVRAAGSPERLPVSGRPADSAVRQRRLDARLSDGRQVRPRSRRLRRTVREGDRADQTPAPGQVTERPAPPAIVQPRAERRVHRGQPAAEDGDEVYCDGRPHAGRAADRRPGTMYVTAKPPTAAVLKKAATDLGITFTAVTQRPLGRRCIKLTEPSHRAVGSATAARCRRAGRAGCSSSTSSPSSGVPADARRGQPQGEVRRADLPRRRHPGDATAAGAAAVAAAAARRRRTSIPAEFRGRLGASRSSKTVPQLKTFLEEGGTILTIGSSTSLAHHLGLPITDA